MSNLSNEGQLISPRPRYEKNSDGEGIYQEEGARFANALNPAS